MNTGLASSTTVLLVASLVLAGADARAQTTELCKWVDENGTVHYDVTCPEGVTTSSVTVETGPAKNADDPYADARQQRPSAGAPTPRPAPVPSPMPEPMTGRGVDLSSLSAEELRAACEQARERLLKPTRDSMIEKCKAQGDQDPGYCERFYADYGNGGMRGGLRIQPLFADLPECVAAREARD